MKNVLGFALIGLAFGIVICAAVTKLQEQQKQEADSLSENVQQKLSALEQKLA